MTKSTAHLDIRLKRAYEAPAKSDGTRVLVDRLWPRGVSRERAAIDLWLKDAAPSPGLRTAWHHDPGRFDDFAELYRAELAHSPALDQLAGILRDHPVVTLVYAARDPVANHAQVLRAHLEAAAGSASGGIAT